MITQVTSRTGSPTTSANVSGDPLGDLLLLRVGEDVLNGLDDPDSVRAHAEALGLPVERMFEVETDLAPG
jgi:hypothetical protein